MLLVITLIKTSKEYKRTTEICTFLPLLEIPALLYVCTIIRNYRTFLARFSRQRRAWEFRIKVKIVQISAFLIFFLQLHKIMSASVDKE